MFRSHFWKFAFVAATGISLFAANQQVAEAQFGGPKWGQPQRPFAPPAPNFGNGGRGALNQLGRPAHGRNPSFDPFDERNIRRHSDHDHHHDHTAEIVGGIIGGILPHVLPPPERYPNRPPRRPEPRVIYTPVPTPIYQPSPPPQNTPKPKPAPPKNQVVARKPTTNKKPQLSNANLQLLSGEFREKQAAELESANATLDRNLQDALANEPNGLTQQQKDELTQLLQKGDSQGIEDFYTQHIGQLGPNAKELLGARVAFTNFQEELNSGNLSQAQIDRRINDLQSRVSKWKDGPTKTSILGNVAELDKYNQLAQLADLVQGTENPIGTLLVGFESAGCEPGLLGEMTGLPLMTESPASDSEAAPAEIVLRNPTENGQEIRYNLGASTYTMKAGERQPLSQSYTLSFDPGDGSAMKEYTLSSGLYHFVLKGQAWDIEKVTPRVKIDNSRYDGTFHYLVNGEPMTLSPGQSVEHTATSAIILEFDRGNGSEPARKVLSTGTYQVGINASNQTLDMYEATDSTTSSTLAGSSVVPGSLKGSGATGQVSKDRKIEEALSRLKNQKK